MLLDQLVSTSWSYFFLMQVWKVGEAQIKGTLTQICEFHYIVWIHIKTIA